jgi:predicted nucleotide-binding protein
MTKSEVELKNHVEDLEHLNEEAKRILATRQSHRAPPGVIAILHDTVDEALAEKWLARAKAVLSEFGRENDYYKAISATKEASVHFQFQKAASVVEAAFEDIKQRYRRAVAASAPAPKEAPGGDKVFIVHGHDDLAKQEVARMLEKLELRPIILHEQPNGGRTIIEKFEANTDVGFAVVLLTPDDVGASQKDSGDQRPRARQNVVLELGYFVGKLGRGRVCGLRRGDVELPSDIHGVVYVELDAAGAWKMKLVQELKSAGFKVDLNKLIS